MVKTIGNVQKDAKIRATVSEDMSAGDPVVVNSDGTVTSVQIFTDTITEAFGSQTDFNSNSSYELSSAFDPVSNKVVIAYQDSVDNKSYCVVGTVSDVNSTTITFGTPFAIHSNTGLTSLAVAFDTNSGKFAVFYTRNGDGYGKVGQLVGTSIVFGSESSSFWSANFVSGTKVVFDPSENVFVLAYARQSNGGGMHAASISGTSLSYGTARQFESSTVGDIAIAYNPDDQNVIVCYRDSDNSSYGTAFTATQDGVSITTSSARYVYTSNSARDNCVVYDTSTDRFAIFYRKANDDYAYGIAATPSGSGTGAGFSFGTELTLYNSGATRYHSAAFDTNVQKSVVFYETTTTGRGFVNVVSMSGSTLTADTAQQITPDATHVLNSTSVFDSNTNTVICTFNDTSGTEGASVVFRNSSSTSTPNLTSENFIGFASGDYTDGDVGAIINSTCSIDNNQSSLTAGQKYYVRTNGTLNLSAGSPSVEAGTAISSTEILVKG